jgi:DNA invertase Pin-like site-specific DNA recombinase/peptidoglycan hydrolase-like protein with peptidoglycan-binding domain
MTVAVVALGAPLATAEAAPSRASASILREGAGLKRAPSAAVRRVQRILERRGFDLGAPGVDGRFGPLTADAVRRAQSRYGLVADGVVGPKTRRLLSLLQQSAAARTRRPRATRPQPSTNTPPAATKPPAATAPPATTTPTATTPQQATPPPATSSQPQTTPSQRQTSPTRSATANGDDGTLPIVLAALAALLAAVALAVALTRGRRRPDGAAPALAAIDRDLYLEGTSERPGIGSFRGFALATAMPPDAADDPRRARYLVDDPRKPAPIWVHGAEIRRSPSQLVAGESVIGYVTIDSDPGREQDAFMEIEALCDKAGWKLEEIVRDRDSGRMVGRPGLTRALERIAAGEARGLVVNDARSLVRSLGDLGALLEWFRDAEAALVAVDLDLDTATIHGHQTASTLITVSAWEADRTASRARRGLTRVQTPERSGLPTANDRAALIERIHAMREAGMSLQAIADQLDNEGITPLKGATAWGPPAVQTALDSPPRRRRIRDELPAIPTHHRQG